MYLSNLIKTDNLKAQTCILEKEKNDYNFTNFNFLQKTNVSEEEQTHRKYRIIKIQKDN